jgi:protein MpaA
VDLNRNLPTEDWNPKAFNPKYPPGEFANSESENQALVSWIENEKPKAILSLHSFERFMMNTNGDCKAWAEAMKSVNSYPIEESIGYPTPGCLGTYAGLERSIPTITYELERGLSLEHIRSIHLNALQRGLKFLEENV